ncbi:MAG: hypothetical protein ACRDVP_01790 [Acidimicrobiales bacterium]
MALSFLYRLVGRVLEVVRVHSMDTVAKDAEILVLRHQLVVVRRQVARPRFSRSDRALIAALARMVPRERWAAFLVTPETILRWHRVLVRRDLLEPYPGLGPLLRVLQIHADAMPQLVVHRPRNLDRKGSPKHSPSPFDEVVELASCQRTVAHGSRS